MLNCPVATTKQGLLLGKEAQLQWREALVVRGVDAGVAVESRRETKIGARPQTAK